MWTIKAVARAPGDAAYGCHQEKQNAISCGIQYRMPRSAQSVVPVLPGDLQWRIVQLLSTRDVCSAAMASKVFYPWGAQLTHVEAGKTVKRYEDVLKSMKNLRLFLSRRGLKVNWRSSFLCNQHCLAALHYLLCQHRYPICRWRCCNFTFTGVWQPTWTGLETSCSTLHM